MKKVGTLTFHRAYNYGAILQAYALQQVLLEEGYDSEIIDYRNRQIEEWFHQVSAKSKILYVYEFLLHKKLFFAKKNREKKFDNFMKYKMKISEEVRSVDSLGEKYNAIIVGSDQIWNLEMTKMDYSYYLPYKTDAKKIAYAASFGVSHLNKEYEDKVKKYLSDFLYISVREETGMHIIQNLLPNTSVSKDVDPTLLIKKESWISIEKPYYGIKPHSYVLMYFVAPQSNSIHIAKKIADENDLELVLISTYKKKRDDIRQLTDVGPEEFIWLIHNAYCVVTTSFHGMVFSLNLNIPFLYELNQAKENTNSRLVEINKIFSLDLFQIVSTEMKAFSTQAYDWDRINQELEVLRAKSKRNIIELLESI